MVFTDIMSEASFCAANAKDDSRKSRTGRRVSRAGSAVLPTGRSKVNDHVRGGESLGELPVRSQFVTSERSVGTAYSSRVSKRSDASGAVPTASSRTSVSVRKVEVAGEKTRGHDAVRPVSRGLHHNSPLASDVSPFDSVSVIGHPRRSRDPEFVPTQSRRNAREPSDRLATKLAEVSSRISPAVRQQVTASSPATHATRSARQGTTTLRPPSVHPSCAEGSVLENHSRASKLVISKDMLADITGTQVCADINLRVVDGHNVVVLRDGASLEVVDEEGKNVRPVVIQGKAHRQALGLPPITPRDLHDAMKSGTNGKYGIQRRGNQLVMVRTTSKGHTAAASHTSRASQRTITGTRSSAVASRIMRYF